MIHRWISFFGEPHMASTVSIDFLIVFEPLRPKPEMSQFARDIGLFP